MSSEKLNCKSYGPYYSLSAIVSYIQIRNDLMENYFMRHLSYDMCDMCGFHTWVGLMRYIVVQMERISMQFQHLFPVVNLTATANHVHIYTTCACLYCLQLLLVCIFILRVFNRKK